MGVRVDMSGVPKKLDGIASDRRVGLVASSEAARLMDKFVPYRSGVLAASAETDEPWRVRYAMPYARRQYYGDSFTFYKKEHPNARSRWDRGIDKGALARKLTEEIRSL